MNKIIKRTISIVLVICLMFSVGATGAGAQAETVQQALQTLEKDVPIIEIQGFGDPIYRGVSTETEDDDIDIWTVDINTILGLVKEHIFDLIFSMLFKNTDRLNVILTDIMVTLFGAVACDETGTPEPDTGTQDISIAYPQAEYGQRNSYRFYYDWRLDAHTLSTQLREFVETVMQTTGSDEVAFVSFSMGGCILMTYLYEYYYLATPEEREHVHSAVFMCGAMNGVACCEDPFAGKLLLESDTLLYALGELMSGNETLAGLHKLLVIMDKINLFDPLINYVNNYIVKNFSALAGDGLIQSMGTLPGFFMMMSYDGYYDAEKFLFNTPEKQQKYSELIAKNRYYHENVQLNSDKILNTLLEDGKNMAVISEYGYSMMPVTSDSSRMSDGTITTAASSFGATCAPLGSTFNENYVQANTCTCGKSHISPDRIIDASTCKYTDITWFAKNLRHESSDRYFADLIDLVTYSDEQVTVWTYEEYPQFMVNYDNAYLVPLK